MKKFLRCRLSSVVYGHAPFTVAKRQVDIFHKKEAGTMKILVTGATSGIGRQLAIDYQRLGHDPHPVGVGSSASYVPLPSAEAYGASKAAAAYMLETLRIDLARENITVSLVSPGFVKTSLTDRNDFPMPVRVSIDEACEAIRRGIAKRHLGIHFPKRFTLSLKALSLLPRRLWLAMAKRLVTA